MVRRFLRIAARRSLFRSIATASIGLFLPLATEAQEARTVLRGYGHLEQTARESSTGSDGFFTMGEHSLFVTSTLNSRFSYLGEFTVRPNGSSESGFVASIERSLVRYQIRDKHALIAGKVHSPVNYWNDAYHHGRVFFPVIDRPLAFNGFIPLHTLGLQLQGQNLGSAKFGYDLMAGNGIAATDAFAAGTAPAMLAAFHVKPREGLRVGASLYYDRMDQNGYGAHSGHGPLVGVPEEERYDGRLDFGLASTSIAYFGPRFEFLHEWNYNRTRTDTLGTAGNTASFAYAGLRIGESFVPFITTDAMHVADNDLHTYALHAHRHAVGFRWEFSPTVVFKALVERSSLVRESHGHGGHSAASHRPTHALRMQFAYGF